ncbi:calponin homology domain-containing protein DDB_G0272472-like [Notolabrus celidotus]|uniref:calponin homology domain-containing protein DDB_G0272472-like n=1 Tax=Notolabrus celidotus TaxID=1203425 RepID=UPI0014900210|nr:calponin homology domain-containing protein DDB_G0272472-like [Notolabrus celidotus]
MDNKRNSESLSRAETMDKETEAEVMLNKIRELKDLVEIKDKQLRDERLKADIKLQKKMVVSHNLQTSLDEAQQERDEMAERLRRKEQEDMRRENDTDVQLEDLKNQLQAERLRSDTLQKEQEEFRKEVKEKNSRDLKQVRNMKMEKDSLDSIIASQDIKLKNKMVSSRYLQTSLDEAKQERDEMAERLRRKEQEMVDLRVGSNTDVQLEDLKNQLQAERLRADTLQKEKENFMQERLPGGQERASRDLKQVQNLEVKGLSPEAKALQMKDLKIKELEELIAREQHQQKNTVMTRYLQTSLEEAKQERDEMAQRLRRKEQEMVDLRVGSNTNELEELKNQLQAERLKSDTLQKEQEDFRKEVKEKASRDLKQVQNMKMEKDSLDSIIASQDIKLKNKMVSSRYLQTSLDEAKQERDEMAERLRRKEQEMVDLRVGSNTDVQLEDLKNQLQAERLRADTLQKEKENFMQERPPGGQERASRDLKQVQNLEVKGLSPEAKALQMKDLKIKELEELIAREQHQKKNNVMTRYLQTSLEEAKQERDEMAQRLRRKEQEMVDLRVGSNTNELEELKNQLQAERLKSDTLQKEQEDFRKEVKEKASRDLKQVQNMKMEKDSLDSIIASQDIKLKNTMVLSRNLQTSLDEAKQERDEMAQRLRRQDQEMVDLRVGSNTDVQLEDLKNQLQAERLRADTLQKEKEDFKQERPPVGQEKASRDLKQVQKLEVKGLSPEAKALQMKDIKIKELEELVAKEQHQQNNNVMTRYLQTSLEEAKQERDEMARVMRKDQEHFRRKTNTDVQRENLDLDGKLASSRALQENKIKELQHLVESLKNQLQAERLRADTLQREQEDFRREVQQKASRDLKQVQNLEEEKRSLKQEVKALRMKNESRIQELEELIPSQVTQLQDQVKVSQALREEVKDLQEEVSSRASQGTNRIKELQDLIESSNDQLQAERLEVKSRLVEMENVSLWRRFKKAITPDSRRQYKHLRMQWQTRRPSIP